MPQPRCKFPSSLALIDPSLRLRRAILTKDTLLVQRILHSHPSLLQNPDFSPTGLSNTSLHLAAQLGHLGIVKLLLSLGHDTVPPTPSISGIGLISNGNGLTSSGGALTVAASHLNSPSHFAQSRAQELTDQGLLFPGSSPTPPTTSLNESHQTPLHLASFAGHSEIVHLLCVSCPESISRRDANGRDAIMLASQNGHDTVVQILLTFWPGGPEAAFGLNFSSVGNGGTGNGADVDGNTALHFASMNGHLLVLRTLLAAGADSERRNVWSWRGVDYSATVQAEVYFKTLVADNERRKQVRQEAKDKRMGGGVRLVGAEDGD